MKNTIEKQAAAIAAIAAANKQQEDFIQTIENLLKGGSNE